MSVFSRPLLCSIFFLPHLFMVAQSIPLGQPINTPSSDEYFPCISGNGKTILFEQLYFNESKPIIQISTIKNGTWSRPETIAGVNSDAPAIVNGGHFVNQNGTQIVFHSSRYGGIGNTDIWLTEKTIIGTWTAPINLAKPVNSPLAEVDPSLSPDGKNLFFTRLEATKTPEGNPCGKIFVSERIGNDRWKTPVALPSPINKGCECGGRILTDNSTFLFSSMRTGGIGGYDMYTSKRYEDGTWSDPVAYSFINSSKDDRYMSIPTNGGLLYHTASGKAGGLDIARTVIPENIQSDKITMLQGIVRNTSNNLLLVPKVIVTNVSTNKAVVYPGGLDGTFSASIPQDGTYDVVVMANEGKFTYKSMLFKAPSKPKYEEKQVELKLTPLTPSIVFPASNLTFIDNTDTLDEFSLVEVNRIYSLLRSNITSRIEIGVHTNSNDISELEKPGYTGRIIDTLGIYTDSTGKTVFDFKTTYTTDNTQDQAKAIVGLLIKKGIPTERILPVGYGNKQPLSPPPTDKALHRRVELKIIHE